MYGLIESTRASTRAPRTQEPRFRFLYLLLTASLLVLFGRSTYLQVVRGAEFRAAAENNRIAASLKPAPRGIIYDVNDVQLVENIASTDAVLDPVTLPSPENEAVLIERLPNLLPQSALDIQQALTQARTARRVTKLASALDHETLLAIEQAQNELPGVRLVSSLVRQYPFGALLPHVVGYTSPVSPAELDDRDDVVPTDITGKAGLERQYDTSLRGVHGVSYGEVDAAGKILKQLDQVDPIAGVDLKLSLDVKLQAEIINILDERSASRRDNNLPPLTAAVIALDPRSGAVRALVSYPAYDPNVFSQPSLTDQTANVIQDERQLLFSRATDGTYPPGSTIKPFIAAAALQEQLITPSTTVHSSGGINVGVWSFPDWKGGGHGTTNLAKAIAESVNTYFYAITGGYESQAGLGIDRIGQYLAQFGWGAATGIDIPNEASGLIPSPAWKQAAKNESWYIGDTYHLGIGQGDVLASPLQVAVATAAIANGGTWYQPNIVHTRIYPDDTREPVTPAAHRLPIESAHVAAVRAAMRETVAGPTGSARSLQSLPVPLAGKTGTAQIGGTEDTHAWFTSFGPYDNPELVVTVLLERAGDGDKEAVPVARQIWEWWSVNAENR